MINILHIITGLGSGGAETALYRLISNIDKSKFDTIVVSITDRGCFADKIESHGIKVYSLGLNKNPLSFISIFKLFFLIFKYKPNLIQSWMYHANILAWLVVLLVPFKLPVVWNIRHSLDGVQTDKRLTKWLIRVSAKLSASASKVIYNSNVSFNQHVGIGYSSNNVLVIPNGFDCDYFKPVDNAKDELCRLLGVSPISNIIGTVGRFHPIKDHQNLIKSFSILSKKYSNTQLVLIGKDLNLDNEELNLLVFNLGLTDRVHFLGERDDVRLLVAGFDVFVLSSLGEAFPNVIGEAMACSVPCVSTDVGDAAHIIGDTGVVVATADSNALAEALISLLKLSNIERAQFGDRARERIMSNYTLTSSIKTYENLYNSLSH